MFEFLQQYVFLKVKTFNTIANSNTTSLDTMRSFMGENGK